MTSENTNWLTPMLLLVIGWLFVSGCQSRGPERSVAAEPVTAGRTEGMAISLRELANDANTEEATGFYGATRVLGYVLADDERGKDVVLITVSEPGRPRLRLDDFVVACLNARSGGVRPACTIDPRAETLRGLSAVTRKIAAVRDKQDMPALLEQWRVLATSPQDVGVFGVDANTHFAFVMVDGDYLLKSVANGAERVDGLTSMPDALLADAREKLDRGECVSLHAESQDRFWFNPGRIVFTTDDNVAMLTTCEVVLLTEQQAQTPEGKLKGMSRPDPFAKRFADDFTAGFHAIARKHSVYRELENLYRFVALADLLCDSRLRANSESVVDQLVQAVQVARHECPRTVAGRSGLKKLEGSRDIPNGRQDYCLYLPSCGGVSVAIDLTAENLSADMTGLVTASRGRVLAARPGPACVRWAVDIPVDVNS